VIETQRWHLGNAKRNGSKQSAVAGYDVAEAINQIGTLKPNVLILFSICLICFLLWIRGFAGSGLSSSIDR
jgi:hypothetical protein